MNRLLVGLCLFSFSFGAFAAQVTPQVDSNCYINVMLGTLPEGDGAFINATADDNEAHSYSATEITSPINFNVPCNADYIVCGGQGKLGTLTVATAGSGSCASQKQYTRNTVNFGDEGSETVKYPDDFD